MSRDWVLFFEDMLSACEKIVAYSQDMSRGKRSPPPTLAPLALRERAGVRA